jgi:hypothetical protein
MRKIKSHLNLLSILVLPFFFFQGCKQTKSSESKAEWINLFDGSSLKGWRAYNGDKLPPGWRIIDSVLTFKTEQILEEDYNYKGSRDIIYGAKEFENFELYVEWKIPVGGNSGIFYHLKEGYNGPPEVSPEYQLIDDVNYEKIHDLTSYNESFGAVEPSKLQDWQKTAADYAMYVPDISQKVLNPAGEWNNSKILFTTERVEYWLNGKIVLSFVPWSDDWYKRRDSGKWTSAPDYGKYKTGYIGFQDHGSDLWFRNIKIKPL